MWKFCAYPHILRQCPKSKTVTISKSKGDKQSRLLSKQQWLQRIVEAEVTSTIDNDSDTRNDKASVQTDKAVRSDCFHININHTIELPFCTLHTTTTEGHNSRPHNCHIHYQSIYNSIKMSNYSACHKSVLSLADITNLQHWEMYN